MAPGYWEALENEALTLNRIVYCENTFARERFVLSFTVLATIQNFSLLLIQWHVLSLFMV